MRQKPPSGSGPKGASLEDPDHEIDSLGAACAEYRDSAPHER